MSNTLEVAMTKELCPVCLEETDGSIVMNTRLTEGEAKKVKELHGKVTGFGPVCTDCKIEGVYLIGVDPEKTDDRRNPYRTGTIIGITNDAFERIFEQKLPPKGVAYVEQKVLDKLFNPVSDEHRS